MINEELKCVGICKSYKDKEVLKDINLTIEPNKIYGMIGRNGAGKTTLLSIMSAQNPATKGQVMLGDENVWENSKALANICFSREFGTNASASNITGYKVKDYLKIASMLYPKWDKNMADELVKKFRLDPKQKIMKLSKGMMSMVTIIVALASKAEYTFMDEPVAGLDVIMREKFYRMLLDEYTETGRTFIISTHIIEEMADIIEEVMVIKEGKLLMKENTQELLERSYHISGKAEDVKAAVTGFDAYHEEGFGRSKGITVVLKEGQKINASGDISVQPVSLQNLFVALCADED
ncbi:MAG: ABC transporter ATP-binding protein [Lachnospiraceae bacterium]|nr:ABC transporter ATP-binding protein [Lachnospiraceae bacterium]